jgi:hypothetical protein
MVDTNGDGLPDTTVPSGGTFVDTDDDGLPDTRLDTYWTRVGIEGCRAGGMTALRSSFARLELAADDEVAGRALDDLAAAVAEARRCLKAPR